MSIGLQEKLEQALAECRARPDLGSLNDLTSIAEEAIDLVVVGDDPELREHVLTNLPEILFAHANIKKMLYRSISGLIVDILFEPGNLDYVMSLPSGEKEVAWFCCDRSRYYYPSTVTTRPDDHFVQILNKVAGRPLPSDQIPTLDNVVSLLYGEHCWMLYSDADGINKKHSELAEISMDIRNAGLSIHASPNANNKGSSELPPDITTF